MPYTFSSDQINSWFQVPVSVWTALSKRACLISIKGWGGGYYTRYSQFPHLNDLVNACDIYKSRTYSNMSTVAHQISDLSLLFNSTLPNMKELSSQPDLLGGVQQALTTIQQQVQAVITLLNQITTDIANFQSLNEAAEASVQNQPLDDSDRFYMAQLGPTAQELTTATNQILLGWTDMLGQINTAFQDLNNTAKTNLGSFIAKVDFTSAAAFWTKVQTEVATFLQNMDGQRHYLSGDYLYDKSPIQPDVGYYIAFPSSYGLRLLIVGDRVQDISGGGYSYHLTNTQIATPDLPGGINYFDGRGEWTFTKAGGYGCYRITNQLTGLDYSLDVFAGSMMPVMLPTGNYTGQFWRFYGQQITNTYIQNKGWLSLDNGTITMSKGGVATLMFSTDALFAIAVPQVSAAILYEPSP
jgi:hypothetical protein